jgi:replication factor A1
MKKRQVVNFKMEIKDLTTGQGEVELEGTISELEETRTFNKYGKDLKVRNAVLTDDSGSVKLTLWNEDSEKFAVGDKVKISKGYVNEFQGEKQLTSGKFGKIEKLGEGEAKMPTDSSTTAEEPEEATGIEDTSKEGVAKEEVEEAVEEGLI